MDKPNVRIISATVTDRGLSDKRPVNEDSYLEMAERGLFAVADGVGGAQAGDFASQTAMEVLQEAFGHPRPDFDAEDLLEIAIQRANESIYQMSRELPQLEMMATTIVTLHIDGNIATIGHVGDSRLYRLDQDGNIFRETNDHSVVEEEVRAGRMTLTQAANHPSRNVISRALGAEATVDVEMRTIMFEPGTTFMLCSDGVTRHIQDYEIREILLNYENLRDACSQIKAVCYSRGAEDNLTAVVVRVEDASIPVRLVEEDEQTIPGTRPVFAPNPLPTLTNGVQRGASATDERTSEFSSMNVVNPDAATAPLDSDAASLAEPSLASSILTPASQTFGAEERPPASEPTLQSKIDNERIRAKIDAAEPTFGNYGETEKSGGLGGWFTSLLTLVVGAVIGAGLLYAFSLFNPPSTSAPSTNSNTTQTNSIAPDVKPNISEAAIYEWNTFERVRRTYDNSPADAAKAASPDNAVDHYLRGRAFLQLGEYENARTELTKANELLTESSGVNKETLRVDIALAQAAVSAMTQTGSDKRPLIELVKTKQSTTAPAAPDNANVTPTATP